MNRVLVTGASGFVGGAVVEALLARACPATSTAPRDDVRIIATCRQASGALRAIAARHPAVTVLEGIDLAEAAAVARLPGDVTHVVHAAALARFEGQTPSALRAANVTATQHVLRHLEATSRATLQRLLYISTFGVHDRSRLDSGVAPITETSPFAAVSVYGRTKHEAERHVRVSGLPHAIARLSWIYGPGMRDDSHIRVLASMCERGHPLTRVDFPGRVSVAFVRDTASAIVELLLKPRLDHISYLVAHDVPVSFGEMFRTFHRLLGRGVTLVRAPLGSRIGRVAAPVLPMKLRSLLTDYYVCDPARLRDEGITMPTTFRAGIEQAVSAGGWFKHLT